MGETVLFVMPIVRIIVQKINVRRMRKNVSIHATVKEVVGRDLTWLARRDGLGSYSTPKHRPPNLHVKAVFRAELGFLCTIALTITWTPQN